MSESASPNRIKANRVNAKKSTGPGTATGKRRVRHNVIKHGFSTLGLLLRLQKNNKITGNLPNLGTLKNEETKPTMLSPQPPQTSDPASTSDAGPVLYDETDFHDISD